MSRILITGGAGFIGYFLTKKLCQDSNNEITLVDNLSRGKSDSDLQGLLNQNNVKLVEGDIIDTKFLSQLDKDYEYIYHLAAIIGVKNVVERPDNVLYVNAISALNIFEYAKTCKNLKKIFFSSTSEVYAGTARYFSVDVPTDENVQLAIEDISMDRTTYALSKMYGESTAFVYGRKYRIPVVIGRFHNVYGPRMGYAHVIPETLVKIHRSASVAVPSPNHSRAFCFIDDAVELIIRACSNSKAACEIFNIGNPKEEIHIKDLVVKIADIMGKRITVNELPATPGSPERRCPDISKIEKLAGYSPVVSLEKGLRVTYDWYKEKLDKPYE